MGEYGAAIGIRQGIIDNSTQRGGLVQVTEVLDATRAHAAQLEDDNALLQHHLNLVRLLSHPVSRKASAPPSSPAPLTTIRRHCV